MFSGNRKQDANVGCTWNCKFYNNYIRLKKPDKISFNNIFYLAQYIQNIIYHIINIKIINPIFYFFFFYTKSSSSGVYSIGTAHLSLWISHISTGLDGHMRLVATVLGSTVLSILLILYISTII